MLKTEKLKLVSEWDKTFPQSEKVDHKKVTFVNRYGITLAADLYKPKNASGKYPAEISCDCRKRTIWGSQRTVFRIICTDNG